MLFKDQQEAFDLIESSDEPWFITGEAGTGKSALLRHLKEFGRDSEFTAVLSFTGAAAVNVDGSTIHSFALQTKVWGSDINAYVPLPNNAELRKKNFETLANVKLLIIDEISMARADLIDALDRAMRLATGIKQKPFGGSRLVMFGDLFQLPPFDGKRYFKREQRFLKSYTDNRDQSAPYFFEAHVFATHAIRQFNLTIPKRQNDIEFLSNLNALRGNELNEDAKAYFSQFSLKQAETNSTRLYALKRPAKEFNDDRIAELPGDFAVFRADSIFPDISVDDTPAQDPLYLKVGAYVMLIKNIDFDRKLVNGATGTVIKIGDSFVQVVMDSTGEQVTFEPERFDIKGYVLDSDHDFGGSSGEVATEPAKHIKAKTIGWFTQIPLVPAYAMTVHKAQGQSIERLTVSFKENYFEAGQAYVALSRATNPAGLRLIGKLEANHIQRYADHLLEWLESASSPPISDSKRMENSELVAVTLKKLMPWRSGEWFETVLNKYLEGPRQITDNSGANLRRRFIYLSEHLGVSGHDYFQHLSALDPVRAVSLAINIDKSVRNQPMMEQFDFSSVSEILASRNLIYWDDAPAPKSQDLDLHGYCLPEPMLIRWTNAGRRARALYRTKGSGTWKYSDDWFATSEGSSDDYAAAGDGLLAFLVQEQDDGRPLRERFMDDNVQDLEFHGWIGDSEQLNFLVRKLFVTPPATSKISLI